MSSDCVSIWNLFLSGYLLQRHPTLSFCVWSKGGLKHVFTQDKNCHWFNQDEDFAFVRPKADHLIFDPNPEEVSKKN